VNQGRYSVADAAVASFKFPSGKTRNATQGFALANHERTDRPSATVPDRRNGDIGVKTSTYHNP